MARLPYVASSDDPETRRLIDRIRSEREGKLLHLYQALLNSPPVAEGWLAFLTAIRQRSALLPRYRELAILRVAVLNRAPYEFVQHVPHARRAGLTEEQIEAVQAPSPAAPLTEADRAVLALTDSMTREIRVPDSVFRPVAALLDAREMTELTATIAAYNMVSRFLEAVQVDHD